MYPLCASVSLSKGRKESAHLMGWMGAMNSHKRMLQTAPGTQ
jgi:hypothetical protein